MKVSVSEIVDALADMNYAELGCLRAAICERLGLPPIDPPQGAPVPVWPGAPTLSGAAKKESHD